MGPALRSSEPSLEPYGSWALDVHSGAAAAWAFSTVQVSSQHTVVESSGSLIFGSCHGPDSTTNIPSPSRFCCVSTDVYLHNLI